MSITYPTVRMRRLRYKPGIRNLIRETTLTIDDLVLPLFIRHGDNKKIAIDSMPGHYQLTIDQLPAEINEIQALNIPAVILFGIAAKKNASGNTSYHDSLIQDAIQTIKKIAPDLIVITDNCFCDYTDHGHCGVLSHKTGQTDVDNDATLKELAKQAVAYAKAGADIIAPSGSLDGVVHAIRTGLDKAHFEHIPILSYSVKFASSLYGPFRDAIDSTPQFGDRKTYQMDPANSQQALREASLDVSEGADMLMVKPAANFLDVIYAIKQQHPDLPLAAYHTSGEFAMIKAASEKGLLDEQTTMLEISTSIKRAGADVIISYFAKEIAALLQQAKH